MSRQELEQQLADNSRAQEALAKLAVDCKTFWATASNPCAYMSSAEFFDLCSKSLELIQDAKTLRQRLAALGPRTLGERWHDYINSNRKVPLQHDVEDGLKSPLLARPA